MRAYILVSYAINVETQFRDLGWISVSYLSDIPFEQLDDGYTTECKIVMRFVTWCIFKLDCYVTLYSYYHVLIVANDISHMGIKTIFLIWTCSSQRRTFFLLMLSFQCTSKLCITFLNQFSVYFHILKMHNTIQSLNCVVHHFFLKNIAQVFIKFTHSLVAIESLTFCKNAKKLFYCSRELSVFRT